MQLAVLVCLLGSALCAAESEDKPKRNIFGIEEKPKRNLKIKTQKKVEGATPVEAAPADSRARELGYLKAELAASVAPFNPRFGIIPSKFKPKGAESTDVEIFWQRPVAEVKGVMFGATGCFHQGGDFFEQINQDQSEFEGCKHSKLRRCQGLPENVYFNKYARERGYLFLTITPSGTNSCWDHEADPPRIHAALDHILKMEGLPADLPMFATGASQGGYLMYDLQAYDQIKNLKCIAPQAAEMKYKNHKEHLPTMIIWMPRDFNITNPVQADLKYLREERKLRVAERTPHPWSVNKLMKERGYPDEITDEVVARLKKAKSPFAQKGKEKYAHKPMTETGFIVDHPGTDGWWIHPIAQFLGSRQNDTLVKDHSKFHQIMQTAYAEHEFTAEYTDHIIDFCENNEKPDELLRLERKPEILKPRKFALICSPTCPKAGGGGGSPVGAFKFPKMNFGR